MKFHLLHKNDLPYTPHDWSVEKEFASIHELFDYGPDVAVWFQRHPVSSYLQYDHGKGLHHRFERVEAIMTIQQLFPIRSTIQTGTRPKTVRSVELIELLATPDGVSVRLPDADVDLTLDYGTALELAGRLLDIPDVAKLIHDPKHRLCADKLRRLNVSDKEE